MTKIITAAIVSLLVAAIITFILKGLLFVWHAEPDSLTVALITGLTFAGCVFSAVASFAAELDFFKRED